MTWTAALPERDHDLATPSASELVVLGAAYLAMAAVSLLLRQAPGLSVTLWPPAGLFVAALLVWEPRAWLRVIPVLALSDVAGSLAFSDFSQAVIAGVAVGHALSAMTGALLLRWWCPPPFALRTLRDVMAFTALAGTVSPIVSAVIGGLSVASGSALADAQVWLRWWIGGGVGVIVYGPLSLALLRPRLHKLDGRISRIEAAAFVVTLAALSLVVFQGPFPLPELALPPLVWAALRFGIGGAACGTMLLSLIAVPASSAGGGPFASFADPGTSSLLLQLYLGITSVTTLSLAALMMQRRESQRALEQANDELELRVAARTEALQRSEDRARQQHAELEVIYGNAPVGLCTIDRDFRFIRINERLAADNGRSVTEHIGRRLRDVLPHLADVIEPILHRVIETGEPQLGIEVRGSRLGEPGVERVWHASYVPVHSSSGAVVGIGGVVEDITARKRVEQELREREERFRALAESMPHFVWETDANGDATFENMKWQLYTGLTTEGSRRGGWLSAVHPDDREHMRGAWLRAVHDGGQWDTYCRFRRVSDGVYRWFHVKGAPVLDSAGAFKRWVCTCTDIHEQRQAEAALRDSEERLQLALHAADAGIWEWHVESSAFTGSVRALELYGLPEQASLTDEQLIEAVYPEDRAQFHEGRRRTMLTGVPFRVEFRTRHRDGSVRWLAANAELRESGGGRRLIGLVQDITERKRMEEELREADQQKDDFIATLAHELRNPLAPVRTAVSLLRQRGHDDPQVVRCHDVIERQVTHMTRLLEDLLDISRLGSNKVRLRRAPTRLSEALADALDIARPLVDSRRHQLTITMPEEPVFVDGDPTRLAQIFSNLLTNAAKYTDDGGTITLRVELDAETVAVTVSDSGIGMTSDQLSRAFDMFSQADSAVDRSQGGLGIGLALVRGLVHLHGGTVEAHSEGAGHGSTFVVRLPVLQGAPQSDSLPTTMLDAPRATRRVLVVDDNRDNADMLATMLQLAGYLPQVAYDGDQALALAEEFRPDVVLLDLGMPRVSGFDVCRALRARAWAASLPIMAMTGWGQEEDMRHTREAGFTDHLVKPLDPDVLLPLLEAAG